MHISPLSPVPPSALVAVVVVMVVMPIAAARFNDAAREQPTSEHQCDHRDEIDAHSFLPSMAVLIAVCRSRRIPALCRPLMFRRTIMLRPALMLLLAFTRFPPLFLTAVTTPISIPIGLLNGERLPDSWDCQGMSRRRSHRSDCQQAKNCKASHDVAHCLYLQCQYWHALRQMRVGDVAALSYIHRHQYCDQPCFDLGNQGVADHDLRHTLREFKDVVPHQSAAFSFEAKASSALSTC
jgi:hypothetical protein